MIFLSKRLKDIEEMDKPGNPYREIVEGLENINKINRFFGGVSSTLFHLKRMVRKLPDDARKKIRILDVATGSAYIPIKIIEWARSQGLDMEIVGTDINNEILRFAREEIKDFPEIRVESGDARRLSFPDESFEFVISSLTLHHFSFEEGVELLKSFERISRYGFIINDLSRHLLAFASICLVSKIFTRNRLTRKDGPLSVRKAYRIGELKMMAEEAGLKKVRIYSHLFFRLAMVEEKIAL